MSFISAVTVPLRDFASWTSRTALLTASRRLFSSASISEVAAERMSTRMVADSGMEFTDVPPWITPTLNDPKTSFNVGVIQGGTSVNSIPESATMRVDIRSAATSEIDALEKSLREAVNNAVREVQEAKSRKGTVTAEIKLIGQRPAADLKPESRAYAAIRAVDA